MNIKKLALSVWVMMYICIMTIVAPVSASGIEICYDGGTHLYTGEVYKLYVNGKKIEAAMEPIIFNDHALVPVREVFEACGATVDYNGNAQSVVIRYNNFTITMHINSNRAYINGKEVSIPDNVVPKLIYKPGELTKTMVPVRFISESVGMNVSFDGGKGEIRISEKGYSDAEPSPSKQPAIPAIESIQTHLISETNLEVTVKCNTDSKNIVSSFKLVTPDRVVVDFKGLGYKAMQENIEIGSKHIKAVRVGVDSECARLVIDVESLKEYSVVPDGEYVTIKVLAGVANEPVATPQPTPQPPAVTEKIIMIDPGHGGADPGALGYLNGKTINEKDLTLSIAYKVKSILENCGYKTAMTRTGDTLPSLTERPEMANNMNCALFVSIHINSATVSARGTEVYYSEQNNGNSYGITSQEFATNVLNAMLRYMNSKDRGVRMANWAVTRRSLMPAVLIEVGFISNASELALMCSEDYQFKTAAGIAEGIINTIQYVTIPPKVETVEPIDGFETKVSL